MPTGAVSRSIMKLGLLFLTLLALAVLPVLAGEHHAATHDGHVSFDHVQSIDLEPCTQDHAVDSDCAAVSSCPVCVIRHHEAGARLVASISGTGLLQTSPKTGQSPAPDIHPPRPSVAA